MNRKIIIILFTTLILILGLGVTYSAFTSQNTLIINQEIASFIFRANQTDHISLDLSDLNPGDIKEYKFSVSNKNNETISNVKIDYQISISTFHFMPLNIELIKVIDEDNEQTILVCDETHSRNDNNELSCTSETQTMNFESGLTEEYIIRTTFDSKCNTAEYSDLVDFIDIEIKSWQKVGEPDEN